MHRARASCLWGIFIGFGCALSGNRIPVSTAFDPLVRFPAEASFAWDRAAISLPHNPELNAAKLGHVIEQEAEAAFAARGYRLAHGEQADYQLSYHLRVDTFIAADRSSATAGLSLLLVDPGGRRVWTGWGRAPFYVGSAIEARRARLRQAIDDMLTHFPPQQMPPE